MGIDVTSGSSTTIVRNTIQNNFYAGVFQLSAGTGGQGEVSGNQFLQTNAHAMIVEGQSFWNIHDNNIVGVLLTGLTVTTTGGNTVIVTAAELRFLTLVPQPRFVPEILSSRMRGGAFQELFVTSIVSNTTALVSGITTSGTGGAAIAGSGDLIDIAAQSGNTMVYNNRLTHGAGGGIVDADQGDSGNIGTHIFNIYHDNFIQAIGGNCFALEQSNSGQNVFDTTISNNTFANCLDGGSGIYASAQSPTGSIFLSGSGVANVWLNGNSVWDQNGVSPFWLVASGLANSTVHTGKNLSFGPTGGTTVGGNASAVVEVP
jgi:hypothetical protein